MEQVGMAMPPALFPVPCSLFLSPRAEADTVSVVDGRSNGALTRDRVVVTAAVEPAGARLPLVARTQRIRLHSLVLS
jgi:hypothetical protein